MKLVNLRELYPDTYEDDVYAHRSRSISAVLALLIRS